MFDTIVLIIIELFSIPIGKLHTLVKQFLLEKSVSKLSIESSEKFQRRLKSQGEISEKQATAESMVHASSSTSRANTACRRWDAVPKVPSLKMSSIPACASRPPSLPDVFTAWRKYSDSKCRSCPRILKMHATPNAKPSSTRKQSPFTFPPAALR